ncbi:MAG: endonuclease/exonuclease/phosphatase family protein [Pseudomonadales bacterium]|nr:endonuclease/exonuclease/phosphatase family protein [Pseudomonadales bacterium]
MSEIKYLDILFQAIVRWTKVGISLVLLFSLLGYLGDYFYFFDLFSHFRLQYFFLVVIFALVLIGSKSFKWLAVVVVSLMINGIEIGPWYFESINTVETSEYSNENSFRILFANVLTQNKQHSKLLQVIDQEKPDIVILQETNKAWIQAISSIDNIYKFKIVIPRSDNFGMAIYSQIPFTDSRILKNLSIEKLPSIYLDIEIEGHNISILSTHPLPPISKVNFESRNVQLENAGKFINKKSGHKIIIGDLNTTMWSPIYVKLLENTGLVNIRRGFGILPSWPESLQLLKIPIDHCLVSSGIRVLSVKIGADIGSDHLPLIIDLAYVNGKIT